MSITVITIIGGGGGGGAFELCIGGGLVGVLLTGGVEVGKGGAG